MSQPLDRISRVRALAVAAELMRTLQLDPETTLIAGSLRRELETVGDIELVAPHPGDGEDLTLELITRHFLMPARLVPVAAKAEKEVDLWAEAPASPPPPPVPAAASPKLGHVIKGAKPGFRYCQLALPLIGGPRALINVDIFRYDPGPQGNRGWIELIRTGPGEFGKAALARWNRETNGYSKDGYPHLPNGIRVPVPTEADAFRLLKMNPVPPRARR